MRKFIIATTCPAPSLNKEFKDIEAVDYKDAVRIAQESWRQTRRSTCLYCNGNTIYYYHRIDYKGNWHDRNGIGGVETTGKLEE